MVRVSAVLVLLAALSVALLHPADAAKLLFSRTRVPSGWASLSRASPSASVRFTVGLRGASVDAMAATFWSISDPTSPDYLRLLSRQQIDERFGPSEQQRVAVQQWLAEAGVSEADMRHVSSAIEVSTTAAVAERLFATEMRLFQHGTSGKQAVKAWGRAELPDHIHPIVELVTGLSSFPVSKPAPVVRAAAPADADAVIPQTIRALYQIRAQQSGAAPSATQAVIEFGGQCFSNNDTQAFAAAVGYDSGNASIADITDDHIVGDNDPGAQGVESTLDVQYMASTNLEAQMWFWIEDPANWLYEYALHALNSSVVPQVVSISYGEWEGMQCFADPQECELLDLSSEEYTAATNALFMKMGMAGTSIVVASGDSGANSRTDEQCLAYNLRPEFPASSPYVTTVGATMVVNATYGLDDVPACKRGAFHCITGGREVAVSRAMAGFTSGGGFSNTTGATRPAYQDEVVQAYLSSGVQLPPESYYNVKGRAEPDVSAVGSLGLISIDGEFGTIGGTSMSAPIFAGVASLVNEIAVSKTGSPLGFLNPLLYKMYADQPETFHDVVEGDNICPEEYCGPNCKGYVATKGWDPVTGLGTPNAARMEEYVNQLMDDVLARRAAQAAAAPAAASSAAPRFFNKQPAQPATFESLRAAYNMSSRWSALRAKLAAGGVQPDETWQGLQPLAIGFTDEKTLVVALASSIVTLSYPELTVLNNCTIDASVQLSGFATSGSTVTALLIDPLYGNVYLTSYDPLTCSTTSSATIKYPTNLLAVDRSAKLAMTSTGGQLAVLSSLQSGERQLVLSNSSWAGVVAGALANSQAWVGYVTLDAQQRVKGHVAVYTPELAFTVELPSRFQQSIVEGISLDAEGKYAYVFYLGLTRQAEELGIGQYSTADGSLVAELSLSLEELIPSTAPIAGANAGEVVYMSGNQLVTLSANGTTAVEVGKYPLLAFPSDVAVTMDGDVLVALTAAMQIVKLNSSGQIVYEYDAQMPDCSQEPFLDVAAGRGGEVLMPLCNGTVVIFGRDGAVAASVNTGDSTLPRGIAAGPRDTFFFTDDNNKAEVTHMTRDGTVARTFTAAAAQWLFSVKYSLRDDTVYATDVLGGFIYGWAVNATGEPTLKLDVSAATGVPMTEVYSLAIDHAHSQMVVSTITQSGSALVWFDIATQRPAGKNYSFVGGEATGVAVSMDGSRVYANDLFNSAVYVFHQDAQQLLSVEKRTVGAGGSRLSKLRAALD